MKHLSGLQQYAVVTANYWAFTLTDGALRMLVVFHFHQLGYSSLEIAFLFLFYEFFGIITNLYGGWLGARYGLRLTLWAGTLLQVVALLMLMPVADGWPRWLSVAYVMAAQAISGIAKDLNKMSAKSAIKTVVPPTPGDPGRGENQLFQWVAILTGSKNALKGVGFFLGGLLLTTIGFNAAVGTMAAGLFLSFLITLVLPGEIGRMKQKPAITALWSQSKGINVLSLARFFLFGARDVWFVVALPVFLQTALGWQYWQVGGFLGLWVIGYGIIQASAPALRRSWGQSAPPGVAAVQFWSAVLTAIPALIAISLWRQVGNPAVAVVVGPRRCRGRRSGRLWCRVRDEFIDSQLHGAGLQRHRSGEPQRGLLLHGQCGRAAAGHVALRRFVFGGGNAGLPVGLLPAGGLGISGRVALATAPAAGTRSDLNVL